LLGGKLLGFILVGTKLGILAYMFFGEHSLLQMPRKFEPHQHILAKALRPGLCADDVRRVQ
jgi:hypothetical protein